MASTESSSEDFSFPVLKLTNPLPSFAISPSLWRVSSAVYPDSYFCDQDDHERARDLGRKSFSCIEISEAKREEITKSTSDANHEEKMDMLWEDFNEELQMVNPCLDNKKQDSEKSSQNSLASDCCKDMMQICRVRERKMSRREGSRVIYQPKINCIVVGLKKIFWHPRSSPTGKN